MKNNVIFRSKENKHLSILWKKIQRKIENKRKILQKEIFERKKIKNLMKKKFIKTFTKEKEFLKQKYF